MDVWILLAAAGSGYLARCWRNSQKPKGSSAVAEEGEQNSDTGPSFSSSQPNYPSLSPSAARRKIRHFSPTGNRRQSRAPLSSRRDWEPTSRHGVRSSQAGDNATLGDGKIEPRGESVDLVLARSLEQEERSDREGETDDKRGIAVCWEKKRSCKASNLDQKETAGTAESVTQGESQSVSAGNALSSEKATADGTESNGVLQTATVAECRSQQSSMVEKPSEVVAEKVVAEHSRRHFQQSYCEERISDAAKALSEENISNRLISLAADMNPEGSCHTRSEIRPASGKRSNENRKEHRYKEHDLFQDGFTGKRMKDALDIGINFQEQLFLDDNFMPGFWDHSQSLQGCDVLQFMMHQGGETRSTWNSPKKVKTPSRSGRGRGLTNRRKRLSRISKPMSSLESCLSAQLTQENDNGGRKGVVCSLFSSAGASSGEQPARVSGQVEGTLLTNNLVERKILQSSDDGVASFSGTDATVGLPPLLRPHIGKKTILEKGKTNRVSANKSPPVDSVCIAPTGCEGVEILKSVHASSAEIDDYKERKVSPVLQVTATTVAPAKGSDNIIQGLQGISLEGLVFNFGVGVGMMFMIISNQDEVKKPAEQLSNTEVLGKDLEQDQQVKNSDSSEGGAFGVKCMLEEVAVEEREDGVSCDFKKVESTDKLLNTTRISFTEDHGSALKLELTQSKDMAKLEAELEAEFERMEINLHSPSSSKYQKRFTGFSKIDADIIGDLVHGELTVEGLPYEVKVGSEEYGSQSPHEEMHGQTYPVSPRELEGRLHKVLENRQQERIALLEAELDALGRMLQEKEEELKLWREQVLYPSGPPTSTCPDALRGGCLASRQQLTDNITFENKVILERCLQTETDSEGLSGGHQFDHLPNMELVLADTKGKSLVLESKSLPSSSREYDKVISNTSIIKLPVSISFAGDDFSACDDFLKVVSDSEWDSGASIPEEEVNSALIENRSFQDPDLLMVKDLHTSNSDLGEEMDLLALIEDCCNGNDPVPVLEVPNNSFDCNDQPRETGVGFHVVETPFCKGISSNHPVPEQLLADSKVMDLLDDVAMSTSGSTPCSIKFMDTCPSGINQIDTKFLHGMSNELTPASGVDDLSFCNKSILSHAGANTPVTGCQIGKQSFRHVFPEGRLLRSLDSSFSDSTFKVAKLRNTNARQDSYEGWVVNQECMSGGDTYDLASDSDELLGELLIKRIVEKTRKGSPIVQEAQSILASLERYETSFSTN